MTDEVNKERLKQSIDRFINDTVLVHDFAKGNPNTLVMGEEGPYPSAAMLVACIQARFDALFDELSGKFKLVTTNPLPIVDGKIQLPSKPRGDLVHNEARVYLDLDENDFTSEGGLKGNRPYLVEEHVNVMVDDMEAVFINADEGVNGCFAVVSYLTL